MKVPYAKKWQKETDKLRKIAIDCGLTEELKWGKPCFTFLKRNVAIVIPLKESCAFSFFKAPCSRTPKSHPSKDRRAHAGGAMDQIYLAKRGCAPAVDPRGLPLRSYRTGGVGREGRPQKSVGVYGSRGIAEEAEGEMQRPEGIVRRALTPGRKKSYIFHISGAKQAKTREARA